MRSHAKASSVGSSTRRSSRTGALALAVSLLSLLVFATSAFAAKEVVDYVGGDTLSGSKGGEFNGPRDVAANSSGVGPANAGDFYVAEEGNNRVQRFDSDGDFISAWGADVIQTGKPGDQAGTDPFEICTVAADCKAGVASGGNGATSGNGSLDAPRSIAIDADSGNLYVSDGDNFRVNVYSGDGTFIRSFGFDVDATDAATGYEVCPAANVCKSGLAGAGAGQIGQAPSFLSGALGIAVSPADANAASGTVFLADTANRRVNTYDLDGTNPSSFGSEAQFGESQPRKVAVDSRGIVYASDSSNSAEIERYDTEDANGGGVGFLAPIAMPPLLEGPNETASSGLAVDPDSDGAGADEDVLYVLRRSWASGGVVQQFGPTNDPGLTAAPTAVDDTHGAQAGFGTFSTLGVGYEEASGQIFVSSNGNVSGTGEVNRVYILDNSLAPGASIDPVTSFDARSATFSGSVDPNGAQVGYRFEYVDDAEFQANGFTNAAQVPISDARVGNGDTAASVQQQTPDSLIAGTTYHVRLVAKQVFSSTETIAGPVTFTTDDSAPSIYGTAASVGTDEATLRGTINPENEAVTEYRFEWGPTNTYGNPPIVGSLPAGSDPVAISAVLSGLTPGAIYHYRLVATSGSGTTPGPDQTFTTQAGPPQFPARAYELASHYPTRGIPFGFVSAASEDGDHVQIGTVQPLPGSPLPPPADQLHSGGTYWQYQSDRGAAGWSFYGIGIASYLAAGSFTAGGTSADGTHYLFSTAVGFENDSRLDPDDRNGDTLIKDGRHEIYLRRPDGSWTWISRDPRIPAGTPQTALGDAAVPDPSASNMSVDGQTVVFLSQEPLSDDDTTSGTGSMFDPYALYKWQGGELTLIGKRPDGSVPAFGSLRAAVSRDGHRVIFGALREDVAFASDGRAIYVQTDGQPTVEATKETGVPPLPPGQPYATAYRGAAGDGSRVFFTSSSRFTPDSGASGTAENVFNPPHSDLYVYDIDADEVRDLTPRLDGIADPSVDPTIADRARVRGVIANSEDGKRVYFVADAQYDVAPNPEGELPSPEGRNLYLAELDEIDDPIELRFVAALGPGDTPVWSGFGGTAEAADTSPDGSVLSFGSDEPLTGQALGGTNQLFVYDVDADTLTCASCPGDGSLPANDVMEKPAVGSGPGQGWRLRNGDPKRWVASDGSVFFNSASPLVPEDQNIVDDVYEYRSGHLRLVSAGSGDRGSTLESISRDGGTVLFGTLDALLPWDEEPGVPKLYAARVGGGFPEPPELPDCDLGAGACEGPGTKAPDSPGAGTAAFQGPGDPKPKKAAKRCPKGKRKVRRKGKARCVPRKARKQNHRRTAKNDRRAGR